MGAPYAINDWHAWAPTVRGYNPDRGRCTPATSTAGTTPGGGGAFGPDSRILPAKGGAPRINFMRPPASSETVPSAARHINNQINGLRPFICSSSFYSFLYGWNNRWLGLHYLERRSWIRLSSGRLIRQWLLKLSINGHHHTIRTWRRCNILLHAIQ